MARMTGGERVKADSLTAEFVSTVRRLGATPYQTDLSGLSSTLESIIGADASGGVRVASEATDMLPALGVLARGEETWAEVAISAGRVGVASTGSVVLADLQHRDRLMALLALRHIVLLPANALVPSLADVAPLVRRWVIDRDRRYVTFVSGPSRTADIERVLMVGVHGPRELSVVLISGWSPTDVRA